jgi:hypothetical protein
MRAIQCHPVSEVQVQSAGFFGKVKKRVSSAEARGMGSPEKGDLPV